MRNRKNIAIGAKYLLVPALCIFLLDYIYRVYDEFDWGHSFTKLLCFGAVAAMIVISRSAFWGRWLSSGIATEDRHPKLQYQRLLLLILFAVFLIYGFSVQYLPQIMQPPRVDIGYTTVHAAELFFRGMQNPYTSVAINVRPELPPEFRGFHYGPLMFISYFPAIIYPGLGFKLINVLCLVVSAVLLSVLVRKIDNTFIENIESAVFALILFLLSNRFWYENFTQGANDIFPVTLLLFSLFWIKKENYLLGGLFAGLSFSAKFSPALFLFVFFIRRDCPRQFLYGWIGGLLPLLAFLFWNPSGLVNNVFICRLRLNYDSTSLYSITPEKLHYLFPLVQLSAVVLTVLQNFKKRLVFDALVAEFTLLLIVVEISFKEVHANHFIWFIPVVALHFSRAITGVLHTHPEEGLHATKALVSGVS